MLKTGDALELGIHPRTLYLMRDSGVLERISRGVYRLADLPPLSDPDLVSVATRVPQGVICLISALAFHRLTREIPHYVHVALPEASNHPRLDHPPLRVFWLTDPVFRAGVETTHARRCLATNLQPTQNDRGLLSSIETRSASESQLKPSERFENKGNSILRRSFTSRASAELRPS